MLSPITAAELQTAVVTVPSQAVDDGGLAPGMNRKIISNIFIARFLARGVLIGARLAVRQTAELPLHLLPTRLPGSARPRA